jgi:hypothetical protein
MCDVHLPVEKWRVCVYCKKLQARLGDQHYNLSPKERRVFMEGFEGQVVTKDWSWIAPVRARADEIIAGLSQEKRGRVALAEHEGGELSMTEGNT